VGFQNLQIWRLTTANADLRNQLNQTESVQTTTDDPVEPLNTALETSPANQSELARLRGQSVRLRQLEQDNTQLRARRQQLERQLRPAPGSVRISLNPGFSPVADVLGDLELSLGVPESFDLGGGTNCVLTPTELFDGKITSQITISAPNADGTVSELASSQITSRPGQQAMFSVGTRRIVFKLTLHTE
jgi:hypothetical protein